MKISALLTTIPSDSHGWNLVFMRMFLEELGVTVENLGTCVPFADVVARCGEGGWSLVVVSTVNGHGHLEGCDLARRLGTLAGRGRFRLVIGGKLGVDAAQSAAYEEELRRAGYDAVFQGPAALDDFKEYVAGELADLASASGHRSGASERHAG